MADKSSDRMAHLPFLSRRDFDVACTQILEAYDKYIAHHDGGTPVPLRIKVQGEVSSFARKLASPIDGVERGEQPTLTYSAGAGSGPLPQPETVGAWPTSRSSRRRSRPTAFGA